MLGLSIGAPQAKKFEGFQPQNHKNGCLACDFKGSGGAPAPRQVIFPEISLSLPVGANFEKSFGKCGPTPTTEGLSETPVGEELGSVTRDNWAKLFPL